MTAGRAEPAAVVLAAGRGSRMSPLTDRVPKPLLTVDNVALLELALSRARAVSGSVAVNAHHLADQLVGAAELMLPGVRVSVEREQLLGTAGALYRLREWIAGRPVIIQNSDVWLSEPVDYLLAGWDGRRPRLLVQDVGRPADFGTLRFLGVSTLPGRTAAALGPTPAGLYAAVWERAFAGGELEFVSLRGTAFDCGTPAEFLRANLWAASARAGTAVTAVIAPDARVLGTVDRSVILAGGRVGPDEHLVGAIRDRFGQTMTADPVELG